MKGEVQVTHEQLNRSFIKQVNQKNVLLCIKRNDGISRAEIAKVLSLSKPTTSKLVQELIDEGWVYEEWREEVNSLGGRRPLSLFLMKSQNTFLELILVAQMLKWHWSV